MTGPPLRLKARSDPSNQDREKEKTSWHTDLQFWVLFWMLVLSGCGPSAEQVATMTASAWTPTPPPPTPTPTATPVPYGLTAIGAG